MNDPPEYEDQDFISKVGRMLDKKNKELCHAKGKCATCCGTGTMDCGGAEISCVDCDGTGKWHEPPAP